jgi:hypothetical protein
MNLEAYRPIQNSKPLVTILSHMNSNHSFRSYYLEINVNITLPSTLQSSKMSLSFRFLYQMPVRKHIPIHHNHLGFATRNILAIITNYEASYYEISSILLIPSIYPFSSSVCAIKPYNNDKSNTKFSLGMPRRHAMGNEL